MDRRAGQAALRVALILEEFTPGEIREALSLLGADRNVDLRGLLGSVAGLGGTSGTKRANGAKPGAPGGQSLGESRALQRIKTTEPDKYTMLSDFEKQLRTGRILPTMEDLRVFGRSLQKQFTTGKTRRDAVGRLTSLLAQMDLPSLRETLARQATRRPGQEDSYRKLAEHIISGPTRTR